MVTEDGDRPVAAARSSTVTGPETSRWPRIEGHRRLVGGRRVEHTRPGRAEADDRARTGRRGREPRPRPGARWPPTGRRSSRGVHLEGTGPPATRVSKCSAHSSPRPGGDEGQEHVVELVGVAHLRGRLGAHPLDRVRVEPAQLARLHRQAPAQRHRARAALADLGVLVEVGERGAVEDLVGQHAGLGGVDEVEAHGALLEPAHQRLEAVDVHGLVEAVAHRLAHERVVGDLDRDRPERCPGRRRASGNTAAIRSSASMRWMLSGLSRPPLRRSTASDRLRFQRQRAGNIGLREHGLGDGVLHVVRAQEGRHVLERERVLRARATAATASSLAAAWSSKSNVQAELLAQPEAERPVDPGARAARGRRAASRRSRRRTARTRCRPGSAAPRPARPGRAAGSRRPSRRPRRRRRTPPARWAIGGLPPAGVEPFRHRAPQPRDLLGQLVGAARRLAQPERDRGVPPVGVAHPHDAVGHLHDLPRMGAEQEDVALASDSIAQSSLTVPMNTSSGSTSTR